MGSFDDAVLEKQPAAVALDVESVAPAGGGGPRAGLRANVNRPELDLAAVAEDFKGEPRGRPDFHLREPDVLAPVDAHHRARPEAVGDARHGQTNAHEAPGQPLPPARRQRIAAGDHHGAILPRRGALHIVMMAVADAVLLVLQHAEKVLFTVLAGGAAQQLVLLRVVQPHCELAARRALSGHGAIDGDLAGHGHVEVPQFEFAASRGVQEAQFGIDEEGGPAPLHDQILHLVQAQGVALRAAGHQNARPGGEDHALRSRQSPGLGDHFLQGGAVVGAPVAPQAELDRVERHRLRRHGPGGGEGQLRREGQANTSSRLWCRWHNAFPNR